MNPKKLRKGEIVVDDSDSSKYFFSWLLDWTMIKCNRQHLSNLHHGQRQRGGQRKTKTINKNKEIQRLIDCARTIIWVTFIEGWQLMSLPTSGLKVCAIVTRKSFRVLLKCCLEIWSASHFQIHRLGAFFWIASLKHVVTFHAYRRVQVGQYLRVA